LRSWFGLSFIHIFEADAGGNPLADLSAFKAFTAEIRERCDEPPVSTAFTQVGAYGTGAANRPHLDRSPVVIPLEILGIPQSNFVRAVRMACEEKALPYDLKPLMPHTPEVLAIHPLGKVPVLRHGDVAVAETRAIIGYLDATFPESPVIPKAPDVAARTEQWISMITTSVDRALVRDYALSYVLPTGPDGAPDRQAIEASLPELQAKIDVLDEAVSGSDCLVGDTFTFADMNLMPILHVMLLLPESTAMMAKAKALTAYYERHATRPSFRNTAPPAN
jgi:glutathione S-transferase